MLGLQRDEAPMLFINTAEPRYNKVLGTRNNFPYLRYNKIYEKEPRYNETSLQRTNPNNTITSVLRPILLARQNGHTFSSFLLKNLCEWSQPLKRPKATLHQFQSLEIDSFKISPRK